MIDHFVDRLSACRLMRVKLSAVSTIGLGTINLPTDCCYPNHIEIPGVANSSHSPFNEPSQQDWSIAIDMAEPRSEVGGMKDRIPLVAFGITSATFAFFAVWLGMRPSALLNAFEINEPTSQFLTEIRAFYGGIELGISLVMIVLWIRREKIASLLVGGVPLGFAAAGRVLGMIIDGFAALHVYFALAEFGGCLFCLMGCWILWRKPKE